MTFGFLIFARMNSSRLPAKSMLEISGYKLFEIPILRLLRFGVSCDDIVVATTQSHLDDPIVKHCQLKGYRFLRGSECDVLSRFYAGINQFFSSKDYVFRLNADSPFVSRALVQRAIDLASGRPEVVSNIVSRSFPYGLSVEMVSTSFAASLDLKTADKYEREHVMPFFYRRSNFISGIKYEECNGLATLGLNRFVVDTYSDLTDLKNFIGNCDPVCLEIV